MTQLLATKKQWWSHKPTVSIYTVNETLVEDLLALNTQNRSVRKSHVDLLAADIRNGDYKLIASGVGLSKTGVLLDGQHRLLALRQCGYPPVQIVVAQGLEDDSQLVVDRHSKRNMADAVALFLDSTVTTNMVAMVNAIYEVGAARGKSAPFGGSFSHLGDTRLADYISVHYGLLLSVASAFRGRAPVCAAIFVYCFHDSANGFAFAEQVATGLNLSADSPAYRLRQAVEKNKGKSGATGRMALFKCAVSAVIAHSRNRQISSLKESQSWDGAPWKWELNAP